MPKSDTPKRVMHDVYVFLDQERFQREMRCLNVARVWVGVVLATCLFKPHPWPLCWIVVAVVDIRFLTLACTSRPRSWCQPCSKRSSWKLLGQLRRSARDGRKAVFRFAALATSTRTTRQNWWRSLITIFLWDVALSCSPCSQWFLFRPWSLLLSRPPPKKLRGTKGRRRAANLRDGGVLADGAVGGDL